MSELSQSLAQKSRNLEALLMRLIAERTQTRLADGMGVDDSTINRWITSDNGLRRSCELLAALGLRLKAEDEPDFDASYVSALETLARHQLDQRRTPR